jgi:hypothetical protein
MISDNLGVYIEINLIDSTIYCKSEILTKTVNDVVHTASENPRRVLARPQTPWS